MENKLADILSGREVYWSKAIAVGSEAWLKDVAQENQLKRYKIVVDKEYSFIIGRM